MAIGVDIRTDRSSRIAGVTPALIKRYYFEGVEDELLPELKKRVPRVSGDLIRSLRFERRGDGFQLRGIRYAPYVTFKLPLGRGYKRTGDIRTVQGVANHLQEVYHHRLLRNAINKALQV